MTGSTSAWSTISLKNSRKIGLHKASNCPVTVCLLNSFFAFLCRFLFPSWPKRYLSVFSRFALVTCFPALRTGYVFTCALHWLHVFPRFALNTCFPAIWTGYLFSHALHWLRAYPRFALVTCFSALCTGYGFSRGLDWLCVFPRFTLVTCLPALCTGYVFSRALHWLRVFPRFGLVTCFPRFALVTCFPALVSDDSAFHSLRFSLSCSRFCSRLVYFFRPRIS